MFKNNAAAKLRFGLTGGESRGHSEKSHQARLVPDTVVSSRRDVGEGLPCRKIDPLGHGLDLLAGSELHKLVLHVNRHPLLPHS